MRTLIKRKLNGCISITGKQCSEKVRTDKIQDDIGLLKSILMGNISFNKIDTQSEISTFFNTPGTQYRF